MFQKLSEKPAVMPFVYGLIALLFILLPVIGFYGGMRYQQQYDASPPLVSKKSHVVNPSYQKPDTLVVIRPEDPSDQLPLLVQTITKKEKVTELYNQIYALPPAPSGEVHCPIAFSVTYTLNFYQNGKQIQNIVVTPTGCLKVQLSDGSIRWGMNTQGVVFRLNLQQTLGLSDRDFYGMSYSIK
jgi:hypothetical protein